MTIIKWRTYCNTESTYVEGYLEESLGQPSSCFNNNTHTLDTTKNTILEKIYTNHTDKIIKWRVYCDTEKLYVDGFTDHATIPTSCFNNNTHIVSKHPEILCEIVNNNSRIQEEIIETGGNIQINSHTFDIPASGTTGDETTYVSSHPIPINMISLTACPNSNNIGDYIIADIGHHTNIGILTENIDSGITGGVTGFGVSQTVIDYLNVGYFVTLTNGVTSSEMGRCVMIDKANNKISTEFPTITDFSAASPTYVQQTVQMIRRLDFPESTVPIIIGDDKIGSSYVPANVIGRIRYFNNDGKAKKFTFYLEYLY